MRHLLLHITSFLHREKGESAERPPRHRRHSRHHRSHRAQAAPEPTPYQFSPEPAPARSYRHHSRRNSRDELI